ncbi:hypothetical protein BSTAB16_6111 [Burkholderia stabilis]|uniref:Uncharacterized protein n=1 Tax=Burkholderia stabilis TaxID=95485 RepID=A0AAJ5ND32_9BURK|nr:hypothetical protein BSTAB16_6111 [Burkholderia stabilis]
MKTPTRFAVLPLTALIALTAQAQQVPTPNDQTAACANAEQNQQVRQRREAQQRDATVQAPGVRSDVPRPEAYPVLPTETPCFRIDRFALDVPDSLPAASKAQGASALPMDRFAFARDWLTHYAGQCKAST